MSRHDEMRAEVLSNQRKLESCIDHRFRAITPGLFGTRYKCYTCGGEVDGLTAKWYRIGREHGAERGALPSFN